MKLKKHMKSTVPNGVCFRHDGDTWLYDGEVCMKLRPGVNAVGRDTVEMPERLALAVDHYEYTFYPAQLVRAELPAAGGIKDAIRIYSTAHGKNVAISNDAWSLIDKDDLVSILTDENGDACGLAIESYPTVPGGELEIVGIIMNIESEDD